MNLNLELEDPKESREVWNVVEQDGGQSATKRKIASSFHTNSEVPKNTENNNRFCFVVMLAAGMAVFIFTVWGKIDFYDEFLTEDIVAKSGPHHSNSFGTMSLKNGTMTTKFYGPNKDSTPPTMGDHKGKESSPHKFVSKLPHNEINVQAHYLHDENTSPYASDLYKEYALGSAEKEQDAFLKQMKEVREKYGAWDFHDDLEGMRPIIGTYDEYPNRDVPGSTFPEGAWQSDSDYVERFIEESLKLVRRVRDGIYEEYVYKIGDYDETKLKEILGINIHEPPNYPQKNGRMGYYKAEGKIWENGIAWMTKSGYDALVRKLLHSMMTNDDFYVVLAGHSAAAGKRLIFLIVCHTAILFLFYFSYPVETCFINVFLKGTEINFLKQKLCNFIKSWNLFSINLG